MLNADIQNAYLTMPSREKCWCYADLEFGSNEGKPYFIVWALYSLKLTRASFRSFMVDSLNAMGYQSSMTIQTCGCIWQSNWMTRSIMNASSATSTIFLQYHTSQSG